MPAKTIGLGAVLIVLGVAVTFLSDSGSVTSMIPSFIGLLFVIIGVIAGVREDLRKHLMHGAAMLALLAILGSLGSLIGRWEGDFGWAQISQVITAVLCAGFIQQAVMSFKAARLAREANEAAA